MGTYSGPNKSSRMEKELAKQYAVMVKDGKRVVVSVGAMMPLLNSGWKRVE